VSVERWTFVPSMKRLLFVIVFVIAIDSFAREPIVKAPKAPPLSDSVTNKPVRARDLGIPFDGTPGPLNAITDVAGVEVGYSTLVRGEGKLEVGKGPVRTGVTAVIPRGHDSLNDPVYAGVFSLNGNGEMTGTTWVEESGFLEGPIVITNTHSVGVARDAAIAWRVQHGAADNTGYWWSLPVVAETWDGYLSDINGFHVKPEDIFHALDTAHGGAIEEGSVGGGTGMICYEFKGGTGTASRKVVIRTDKKIPGRSFTTGVLVQANCGRRPNLTIAGVRIGKEIPENAVFTQENGSIIIVVATDAPLLPHQLKRLARRAALGLARTGSYSGNGSGDLFIAFSTANPKVANSDVVTHSVATIPNDLLDPIFEGVVDATEEAIVNALVDQEPNSATATAWQMDSHSNDRFFVGAGDHRIEAMPRERVKALISRQLEH
jgi:D-aminopeptidase